VDEKREMLKKIADLEYQFLSKINATNPECKREATFKFMRISRFYPYSEEVLLSYMEDLERARKEGRNPLYEKYACMEGKVNVAEEKREIIEKIVEIEKSWINELHKKYPHVIEDRGKDFQKYLSCELSTFSLRTLKSYLEDVERAAKMGRNLALESYHYTFSQLGYSSLEEVEEKLKREKGL